MKHDHKNRIPYVGAGEDGSRRSAAMDREEADTLGWDDLRKQTLYESADRWEDQAHRLLLERVGPRPTLSELRREVGNESWLAALAARPVPGGRPRRRTVHRLVARRRSLHL